MSIDPVRVLFKFFIVGSSSFKASFKKKNLILKGTTNISNTLRSDLNVFCLWIFFSLINFLFIFTLALTVLWSLPISTLVMTSQFPTIFLSEDSMKSLWFLPPGASHVQCLFNAFWKNEFVTAGLFSSA